LWSERNRSGRGASRANRGKSRERKSPVWRWVRVKTRKKNLFEGEENGKKRRRVSARGLRRRRTTLI